MAQRIVIVPQDSPILQHTSTQVIHIYANGDRLVATEAVLPESGASSEQPVERGLRLAQGNDADLDQARERLAALQLLPESEATPSLLNGATPSLLAYVEFVGSIDPQWLTELIDRQIEPLRYHPEQTYLCQGTPAAFQAVATLPFVLHVTPLTAALKPGLVVPESGTEQVWIVVHGVAAQAQTLVAALNTLPGVVVDPAQRVEAIDFYLRLRAEITSEGRDHLLEAPRVLALEPYAEPTPEDEMAGLILAGQYDLHNLPTGSYLHWLEDYGLNGKGVTIGIVDTGVDVTHAAFQGRIKDLTGGRKSWHGTFVAGHAAGCYLQEKDRSNLIYGLGTAPAAELLIQDNATVTTAPGGVCQETVMETGPSGQRGTIQNNSWGAGTKQPMDYSSLEAAYDRLVRNATPDGPTPRPLTICFSSGNSGASGLTRPKAAKNIIVTGNSENYRPDAGGVESDSINEVFSGTNASSYGNCGDERVRPDIVAPGEWTASANFSARPGDKEYISPQLTWGGGSSGASPKTAGACALLTQWWRRHNHGRDPSPALLRALIVNGAVDTQFRGAIPNKYQGWGRLNLENILTDAVQRVYVDQSLLLTMRGEQQEWRLRVSDPTRPVKITLAWTDPPGAIGSGTATTPAIVNRLALQVEVGGTIYYGNNFANGWSVAGSLPTPTRAGTDNLQNVYLPAGVVTTTMRVTVTALQLTTDCFSGKPFPPQQDFALVVHNGTPDERVTPADVFVGVDQAAQGQPKEHQPADFWDTNTGAGDAEELDVNWWWEHDQTTAKQPESSTADDWWISAENARRNGTAHWLNPESERTNSDTPPLTDQRFVQALQTGSDLLTAHPAHRVILPPAPTMTEAGTQPATPPRIDQHLREILATLRTQWQQPERNKPGAKVMRRRVAVLVVGAGTRITPQDLEALRWLAFQGQLYLISDHAPILAFLAQRIHRQSNSFYRLAPDADSLAALVRDTMAEAGGAQQVELQSMQQAGATALMSAHRFSITSLDTRVMISIAHVGMPAPEIKLRLPGQTPFAITASTARNGMQLIQRKELTQITFTAPDQPEQTGAWAGLWEMQLRQTHQIETTIPISVWSYSHLHLHLQQQDIPTSEAGTEVDHTLIALTGTGGVTISRMQVEAATVGAEAMVTSETTRTIDVRNQPSRLMTGDGAVTPVATLESERSAETFAPSISAQVPMARPAQGAAVLDLQLRVRGQAAQGQSFQRLRRANLIRLEPRQRWRQRMLQPDPVHFFAAQVRAVQYAQGRIIGLHLQRANHQREVQVTAALLQDYLAACDLHNNGLHFAVSDHELLAIIRTPNQEKTNDIHR